MQKLATLLKIEKIVFDKWKEANDCFLSSLSEEQKEYQEESEEDWKQYLLTKKKLEEFLETELAAGKMTFEKIQANPRLRKVLM